MNATGPECPQCGTMRNRVLDIRPTQSGWITRRRECEEGHRFTTRERPREKDPPAGSWYVEERNAGADVLEVGAGAGGGDGLVAAFEIREEAEEVVRAHNARGGVDDRGWCWKGYAGHWCMSRRATFHLATILPTGVMVSTVGGAYDDDGELIQMGVPEGAYFETMVFECEYPSPPGENPKNDLTEIETMRYETSMEAEVGHYEACERYANEED